MAAVSGELLPAGAPSKPISFALSSSSESSWESPTWPQPLSWDEGSPSGDRPIHLPVLCMPGLVEGNTQRPGASLWFLWVDKEMSLLGNSLKTESWKIWVAEA